VTQGPIGVSCQLPLSLCRENQYAGAEGETASETLRPKDRLGDEVLWRVVPHAPAEGIAISGERTEGASRKRGNPFAPDAGY
jgi:hypothetical protein